MEWVSEYDARPGHEAGDRVLILSTCREVPLAIESLAQHVKGLFFFFFGRQGGLIAEILSIPPSCNQLLCKFSPSLFI